MGLAAKPNLNPKRTAGTILPTATPTLAQAHQPSDVLLERLTRLHPKIIDLTLDRVERLMARLDHPEQHLPPVVHVAGTNGKGSVIAFLRAMLEAAGKRAHVYTSPHLVRFHERIRLAGRLVDESVLATLLEECEEANGEDPITFFEITTAAALLAFARTPADVLLLETGLGGRLDATNVVAQPRLTVITPISIDHVQYLGESIEEIASEKAGILKSGVPAVIGPQPAAAAAVIETRARAIGAPLHRAGTEWDFTPNSAGMAFRNAGGTRQFEPPGLTGAYQRINAACAIACAEQLADLGLGNDAAAESFIRGGLQAADWPARLQRLNVGPLCAALPEGWELWLDGGHNAAAGSALAETIASWDKRPLHLICGMLNNKAVEDFLRPLMPFATSLRSVTIEGVTASLTAEEVVARMASAGGSAEACASVLEAVENTAASSSAPGRVLICGSLYLAGTVLAQNG